MKTSDDRTCQGSSLYQQIYNTIRLIPCGRVATYGQIAAIIGKCGPRQVGYALAATPPEEDLPWHRVINSKGMVSVRAYGDICYDQRLLLEEEGVAFNDRGCVDLDQYGWDNP